MMVRKSGFALTALATGSGLLVAVFLHAAIGRRTMITQQGERATLVRQLGLSDLALFTEARYTRHPSQADLFSAFQDHPVSLDHFPTGSLIGPPKNFQPSWIMSTGKEVTK